MRLLLVTDSYAPLIGGATRAAELLALELRRRGDEVAVITVWQPSTPVREVRGGIDVHRVKGLSSRLAWLSADRYRRTPPPFPDPEMTWRIRRVIKCWHPDVVHSYGWLSYSCAVALLGIDLPLVVSSRDYAATCALRTLVRDGEVCSGPELKKCLACAGRSYGQPKGAIAVAGVLGGRRLIGRRLNALHSVSRFVRDHNRDFLLGERLAAGRVIEAVLPDFSVERENETPDPDLLKRLPSERYILFVGALRMIKGLEPLLAAYAQLEHAPPLVLIGTPAPDTPSFPDEVTVLTNVPHATVLAAWDGALFGVAPSILPEPLGNVIHEAMSQGRTVIGTRPGGHEEMIEDEVSGLLVAGGDVGALAGAMQRLIDDSGLRERMELAARGVAERFTAEIVMPRFQDLYRTVAATRCATVRDARPRT